MFNNGRGFNNQPFNRENLFHKVLRTVTSSIKSLKTLSTRAGKGARSITTYIEKVTAFITTKGTRGVYSFVGTTVGDSGRVAIVFRTIMAYAKKVTSQVSRKGIGNRLPDTYVKPIFATVSKVAIGTRETTAHTGKVVASVTIQGLVHALAFVKKLWARVVAYDKIPNVRQPTRADIEDSRTKADIEDSKTRSVIE